jgi:hypothetical protein
MPAVAQVADLRRETRINNDFVQKQFGSSCTLIDDQPPAFADMDGDGVEDLVIAAKCTNPMVDQTEHGFLVVDPYYAFFGYGDPKITSSFITDDPAIKGRVVLVIHGSGVETWHAPKAKFALINLSFKKISVKKMMLKKRKITAIYTEESGGDQMVGAIFWDGKKYKYMPMGSTME